ncbi:hypothetical protein CIB48_g9344 [Xylaria polymorpha]|nr:hypothetical protein CIB48_g9344 [Xylaria polymorpha]
MAATTYITLISVARIYWFDRQATLVDANLGDLLKPGRHRPPACKRSPSYGSLWLVEMCRPKPTHIAPGQLTWRCVGNRYYVTLLPSRNTRCPDATLWLLSDGCRVTPTLAGGLPQRRKRFSRPLLIGSRLDQAHTSGKTRRGLVLDNNAIGNIWLLDALQDLT